MILTVGLSPAWQQILVFNDVSFGQVNRARQAVACASGKAINVARALHRLGEPVHLVSLKGGATGNLLQADIGTVGIPTTWIDADSPTRVCTTVIDRHRGQTTELVENAPRIASAVLDQFRVAFLDQAKRASTIVLSGTLPEGTPRDFYCQLMDLAPQAKYVLDVRGHELWDCLIRKPLVVKPNREELGKTVGQKLETSADVVAAAQALRACGCEWVVVSNGADPLLVVGPDGDCEIPIPPVNVINPIGCGDCLAAGIAAGLAQGMSFSEAVTVGVATAAENAKALLPADIDRQKVMELLAQIRLV